MEGNQVIEGLELSPSPFDSISRFDVEETKAEPDKKEKGNAGTWIAPIVPVVLTLLAYVGTLSFPFVFDDKMLIVQNPRLRSWRVLSYLTEHMWVTVQQTGENYYRPVLMLWFGLNYLLFGLKPFWWHLVTLSLHMATTLFVYLLAKKLSNDRTTALWAGIIFGLHPVHIEVASWVSGTTESLMAAFLLGAFLCYLKARETVGRRRIWILAAVLCYLLAMFEKESAIVLPGLIFAYEWLMRKSADGEPDPFRTRARAAFKAATPFLAVVLFYLAARVMVLKAFSHNQVDLSLLSVILTLPSVLWSYFTLLVWPVNLGPFYEAPYVDSLGFASVILPLTGILLFGAALIWITRQAGWTRFALLFMLLPLLPLMNLPVLPKSEIVHDRYLYLPSVGFALILAFAISRFRFGRVRLFGQPALEVSLATGVILFLGVFTAMQQSYWASEVLLYHRGLQISPNNALAKNNMGASLLERGYPNEAVELFHEAAQLDSDLWVAQYNYGCAAFTVGRLDDAEKYLKRAILLDDRAPKAYLYLGMTYKEQGRLQEAEENIRISISKSSTDPVYHFSLALVLRDQGKLDAALEECGEALKYEKDEPARDEIRKKMGEIQAMSASAVNRAPM